MKINLTVRDKKLIKDVIYFKGLPTQTIIKLYFNGSETYAKKRLSQLKKAGYLENMFYNVYCAQGCGKRKTSIIYATHKAIKVLRLNVNSKRIIPAKKDLDEKDLIGKLYGKIPTMLPAKLARRKSKLHNYDPVSCIVPSSPPLYISILGSSAVDKESRYNRVRSFSIKTKNLPFKKIVVAKEFHPLLLADPINFISWDMAEEAIPNIAEDENYYINKLKKFFLRAPGKANFHSIDDSGLIRMEYSAKTYYIAELFTGSNKIRKALRNPAKNTIIYVPHRNYLHGIDLHMDYEFYILSHADKALMKVTRTRGGLKTNIIRKNINI